MNLSFVETMRGHLQDASGKRTPVDFQIRTRSTNKPGHFTFDGVVHAEPWCSEGPCEGTLIISLVPASIAYVVRFSPGLILEGHKSPTLLSPFKSMSVLPIALRRESGQQLASGTMYFDFLELPQFLASWLPRPTVTTRRFEARHRAVTRRALIGG